MYIKGRMELDNIKSKASMILIFILTLFSIYAWKQWGFIGFISVWFLISLALVVKEWDLIIAHRNMIEYQVFGKMLNKENWTKEELISWKQNYRKNKKQK